MRLCFLLPVLALALPAFAEPGFYGPITAYLKVGDPAPDITFNDLISAPISGSWSQSNLTGQLTVLVFYPDTSHNLQTITMWNAVVEKFTGKPAQFIFITGEKESTLKPFLNEHPIKGWVFLDSAGKTGNAYGLERPVTIYIGPDRKVLGFTSFPLPEENTINAALEHRITTTPPNRADLQAFRASNQVLLEAEPERMPRIPRPDEMKPKFPPSTTLHVSPSTSTGFNSIGGDTYRTLQNYTLKAAIQDVYRVNPTRIILPASLDTQKNYDLSLSLPEPAPPAHITAEQLYAAFQQGILDNFHLSLHRETRLLDVYIITTDPNHALPVPLPNQPHGISSSGSGMSFHSVAQEPPDKSGEWSYKPTLNELSHMSFDGTG
jgi:peroxiredoxin